MKKNTNIDSDFKSDNGDLIKANSKQNSWEKDEQVDKEEDIFSELSSIRNQVENLKNFSDESQKLELKIQQEKMDMEKLQEKIKAKKLLDLNATLETEKRKKSELLKEYNKLKFETEKTKELTKERNRTEMRDLEAKITGLRTRQLKISELFHDLKNAEKVDICFLLDCTGSMASYINQAKTVIHDVVNRLKCKFRDFELRCSFVGYRDHCDGANRVVVFPFNSNEDAFKSFVNGVAATGGTVKFQLFTSTGRPRVCFFSGPYIRGTVCKHVINIECEL